LLIDVVNWSRVRFFSQFIREDVPGRCPKMSWEDVPVCEGREVQRLTYMLLPQYAFKAEAGILAEVHAVFFHMQIAWRRCLSNFA